jgi:arginyl-tRNA synthetase
MYDYKEVWKQKIASVLFKLLKENVPATEEQFDSARVVVEIPPSPEMGDLGFPMFGYAKLFKKAPNQIAQMVSAEFNASPAVAAIGPYVNVRLNRAEIAENVLKELSLCHENKSLIGKPGTHKGLRIMIEFSGPNTNKPLHLGHLRNDVLGESMSRILSACGAEVRKVNIINDRGIHICKSMLAYKEHGEGKTPESAGVKTDHFVGDWYVRFNQDFKEETSTLETEKGLDKKEAEAQAPSLLKAKEMLRQWEAGESETVALWKKMTAWAIDGWEETYKRTGVSFHKYDFESDNWILGKNEVLKGLQNNLFYREDDGAIAVDLSAEKLDKKILLRSDGTSLYITQDFGIAINRYKDWSFDRLIYVVGSEQQYHFKVLFVLLEKLGYTWAKNLYHLSYGMVNLPEGKMKSREGTIVDADDLIDSLRDMALEEIRSKEREEAVGNPDEAAEKIAIGALHYFLLQVSPSRDMLFDPKESLSFNGNTGPYLQYMGARISSLLRKAGERNIADTPRFDLLNHDAEWELVKVLAAYDNAVAGAAESMDTSILTAYLYELAKAFSRFYHDCPIINAEMPELAAARLVLCRAVLFVLSDALYLTCIPFLEAM